MESLLNGNTLLHYMINEELNKSSDDSDSDETDWHTRITAISSLFLRESHEQPSDFMSLLEKKDDVEFFKQFRMTRPTFNLLAKRIENYSRNISPAHTGGREPHSARLSLAATLWYMGRRCTFQEVSNQFGISLCSSHRTVHKTINIINNLFGGEIKWPSAEDVSEVESEFKKLGKFEGVIGAVDACRIEIRATGECNKDYIDRTSTYCMILLAVCDAKMKFTYIYAGFPGGADVQDAFSHSSLGIELEKNYISLTYGNEHHLIGDSSFVLKPYMMVPFEDREDLSDDEIQFNAKLSKTRQVIETSFAWLICRFQKLKFIDAYIDKAVPMVTAACILHNITLKFEEELLLLVDEVKDYEMK